MKIKQESFTIVIVGAWNVAIFDPNWVCQNVFHVPNIKIEFPVLIKAPPRYSTSQIRLYVDNDKLIFAAIDKSDSTLEKMQTMAQETCSQLPHTPLLGIGMNFGFLEDQEITKLTPLFDISDNKSIAAMDGTINSFEFKRAIFIKNHNLNLTIKNDQKNIEFEFNYHNDIKDINTIPDIFKKMKMTELLSITKEILKNIYSLEISTEDNEHE